MRRILFVLTVGALMAVMTVVSAGPAQANDFNFGNSSNFVLVGDSLFGFGDIDDDDGIDFDDFDFDDHHHCCHHFGNNGIIFSGIEQDSRSGDIRIR